MTTDQTVAAHYPVTLHTASSVTPPTSHAPEQRIIAPQRAVRRSITPQAGHALEILGHAIEYLTDEYVHERGYLDSQDERMETVQLLMQLNRQVYAECPELPSIGERCISVLHRIFRHNLPHSPLS